MSRHTKKNSSSRYSQTSARRSSSQPRGGSMRTTEGTLACSGRGATDCGGAVTDAIDLALSSRGKRAQCFRKTAARKPSARTAFRLPEIARRAAKKPGYLRDSCGAKRQRTKKTTRQNARAQSRSSLFLHLLDVALLNLAHQVVPMKQVILQMGRELPRHDEELVVDHLTPGNRPARGNQVRAPLKHKRRIPEHEAGQHRRSGRERRALRAEERGSASEQNTEPKNKQRSQRHQASPAVASNRSGVHENKPCSEENKTARKNGERHGQV